MSTTNEREDRASQKEPPMAKQKHLVPPAVEKLEEHLERKDISMRKFAEAVDVWPSRLCKIMQGKVSPTLREACAISAPIRGMKAEDWLAMEGSG